MFTILVVEDNADMRELFCTVLSDSGYHAIPALDGMDALDIMDKEYIDLIVADIMMPNMDGYELTRSLRAANYDLPILMVTAKDQFEDIQRGFRSGTDDYMVKPINVKELVLRVEALLRRAKISSEKKIVVGSTVLNYDALTVTFHGQETTLPQKEFYLLYKLLSYPNKIFTRRYNEFNAKALLRNSFFQFRNRFGWMLFSAARVLRSFSPFNSSITRSDLNLALKLLLCLDIVMNPLFRIDFSISDSLKTVRKNVLIYETIIVSEKLFSADKSFIGSKSMRVQTTQSLSAKMFVEFIALIVRNRMYNLLKETMLRLETKPNYMTVPAALRELEKIEMVRRGNGHYRLDHAVTKKQKTILSAFGLSDTDVKSIAIEIGNQLSDNQTPTDKAPEEGDDYGEDTFTIID